MPQIDINPNITILPASTVSMPGTEVALLFFDSDNLDHLTSCKNVGGVKTFFDYEAASGVGTVTSFSSGNLAPLFSTSVATAGTTPALSFSLTAQLQNLVFASPDGVGGVPSFRALVASDIPTLPTWNLNGNTLGNDTTWTGSIDNFDYSIRTNSVERLRFLKTGEIGIGTATPTASVQIQGAGATLATFSVKIENSVLDKALYISDDTQVQVGGIADSFYQMKINTQGAFIGGLFIDNGAHTGYALELGGSVGHGLYITAPATQNAINVIAARSQFGGIVGIGSMAQAAYSLRVTTDGTFATDSCIRVENTASAGTHAGIDVFMNTAGTQIQYGIYLDVTAGTTNYSIYSIRGNVNLQSIPVGNAGLVTGDLYQDTAANILGNGDNVVGIKV